MTSWLKWYFRMLKIHPWRTQVVTAGTLMASGDIICQTQIEDHKLKDIELPRTLTFGTIGTFYVGPVLCVWYRQLEKIFGISTRTIALKKMLLDQVVFAPVFLLGFFAVRSVIYNNDFKNVLNDIEQNYVSVLKANYVLWPMAQLVTFYAVPLQHRILFVSVIALFWNTYLAWKTNSSVRILSK